MSGENGVKSAMRNAGILPFGLEIALEMLAKKHSYLARCLRSTALRTASRIPSTPLFGESDST